MEKKNIPLEIKKQPNLLDGKVLLENANQNILNKLIDSDLLLKSEQINKSDMYTNLHYETEREQLIKYRENIKFGRCFVQYDKTKNMSDFGRVYPKKSLGLFSMRKEVRGALAFGLYRDIDLENAHPSILLQICNSNNIECKYLKKYVSNRDKYFDLVMKNYNVARSEAKQLFIMLLYLGSFNRWKKINNIIGDEISYISKLKNEIKNIGLIISDGNPDLKKCIKTKYPKKTNITGSIMSYVLQEWEYRIIEQIYIYCKDNQIINNDCVICADGIMIANNKYDDNILETFHDLILEKLGFDLKFVIKELNQVIYNKLI